MTSRPIRQAARTWPPRNPGMIRPIWLSSLKNIAVRKSSDLRFHNRTGGHGRPKARKGSHMDVILPKFRTHPAQDTDLPRARRTALPRNATRPAGRPGALVHPNVFALRHLRLRLQLLARLAEEHLVPAQEAIDVPDAHHLELAATLDRAEVGRLVVVEHLHEVVHVEELVRGLARERLLDAMLNLPMI